MMYRITERRQSEPDPSGARGPDDDRAVSEVVSFMLAFAMITMMIGILYAGGSVAMAELETGNQIRNAQSVFIAMDDSFGELQEGQAPKRAGAIDLDVGASLAVRNRSSIQVTVNGPGFSRSIPTRSLVYTLEERSIAYESGAVFRTNDGDDAMIGTPPELICSPSSNGSIVSIVTIVSPGGGVAAGTATVTGIQRSTQLLYPTDRAPGTVVTNVTVNVTSPRAAAWHRHLDEAPGWTDGDGDGTYACESAESVFVRQTVVEVQLQN